MKPVCLHLNAYELNTLEFTIKWAPSNDDWKGEYELYEMRDEGYKVKMYSTINSYVFNSDVF